MKKLNNEELNKVSGGDEWVVVEKDGTTYTIDPDNPSYGFLDLLHENDPVPDTVTLPDGTEVEI